MSIHERKEREKERRRQQILVAAKKIISRKGFNNTIIEDIAAEAELSPGTLYNYFKNKEELFAFLSLRLFQFLNIWVEQALKNGNTDPVRRLENLVEALHDVYHFDPQTFIYIFHVQSDKTKINLSPELLSEFKRLSRKSIDIIAGIFKEGVQNGRFVDKPPDLLAGILLALFTGVALWSEGKKVAFNQEDDLKQKLVFAFDLFSRGIKKQDMPTK